jgi:hypothetical protein
MIRDNKPIARDKPHIWFRSNQWVAFQFLPNLKQTNEGFISNKHPSLVNAGEGLAEKKQKLQKLWSKEMNKPEPDGYKIFHRSQALKNEATYWTGELRRTAKNMIGNPADCLTEAEMKLVKEINEKAKQLQEMIEQS